MKNVNDLRKLRDIRTGISTHSRSVSRTRGTPYLEILSLGMEKLRLETERAQLLRNKERIDRRLAEIRHILGDRLDTVQEEISAEGDDSPPASGGGSFTNGQHGPLDKSQHKPGIPDSENRTTLTIDY